MRIDSHIEADIVQKAMQGNEQAKATLYHSYATAMYNICIRMAGNKTDAEDILQEAFIAAFLSIDQLKDVQRFGGWIKKITISKCIAFCKKKIVWQEFSVNTETAEENIETNWFLHFELKELHEAIKELPEGCRQVFTLFALENKAHKEIADLLEISVSTSKSQYHRAKTLLRKNLTSKK